MTQLLNNGMKATMVPNLACECGLIMACEYIYRGGIRHVVMICRNALCPHKDIMYIAPQLELVPLQSLEELVRRGVVSR